MVVGIGTDILRISDLETEYLKKDDPFLVKTYTDKELLEAEASPAPKAYYASRFAGKEAVFKCLNRESDGVLMNEIEILKKPNGQPYVTLHGRIGKEARKAGIQTVLISLSYDKDYAIAFANALGNRPGFGGDGWAEERKEETAQRKE